MVKDITLEDGTESKGVVERWKGKETVERPEKRRESVKSVILESKVGEFKEEVMSNVQWISTSSDCITDVLVKNNFNLLFQQICIECLQCARPCGSWLSGAYSVMMTVEDIFKHLFRNLALLKNFLWIYPLTWFQ